MPKAFLLTRQTIDTHYGVQLQLWFSSDDGPIKVIIKQPQVLFFVKEKDIAAIQTLLLHIPNVNIKPLSLKNFESNAIAGVYFQSQQHLYRARDLLTKNNINCYESDIRPTERFLTERFLTGPVFIDSKNNNVRNIINPKISPTPYQPKFTVMSFDIETNYKTDELFSIAFIVEDVKRVLMIGNENSTDLIEYVKNERALLQKFMSWIEITDPDIFIGWNVINFDFKVLQKRADFLNIALIVGRQQSKAIWRQQQNNADQVFILIPGRVVLDGIDTLKSATYSFGSFALDSVGHLLLGRGKLIATKSNFDPLYKAKEIIRQFNEDKPALAEYNLEDCQLVSDIFEHTDLNSSIERARLTGLEMDRFGGSVAAFDNLYLPLLHRKGYVAPNIGDYDGQLTAPGGYVMDSIPGMHDSVLVLDYKSLYPSIIRTFKVDPLGRISAQHEDEKNTIPGYDGAKFSKSNHILPNIIEQLWKARDKAKEKNNKALSQAIKIIMNSFYGVLGTPGCRIHDSRLTSSITKRSHDIILQTVELIENQGYTVIYGDTDSVFVSMGKNISNEQASHIGSTLTKKINQYWANTLKEKYDIESHLEMEFETHYNKFFMPTIRGSDKGSKKRYAGLVINDKGEQNIVFKGLETVRTDWTQLAKEFQKSLYNKVFNDQPYDEYIRETITQLKSGDFDEKLIYRKRLRQYLQDYQKNVPPHAQAAIKAEKYLLENDLPSRYARKGWIEYVITSNGPEALECQSARLNYEHYIDKQLIPIGDAIISVFGSSMTSIISNQTELF